ncbi:MAG: hypothetical protein ACJ72K_12715, partial [Friedmanniella sp.]
MTFTLVVLAGALVAAGLVAVVVAVVPAAPRLEPALARAGDASHTGEGGREVGPVTSRSERLGAALYRRTPIPLSQRQRQALRLRDKSIPE